MDRNQKARKEMKQANEVKQITEEEMKKQRLITEQMLSLNIATVKEEIAFREKQLESGEIIEKSDNYTTGVKPDWALRYDVESQKITLKQWEEQLIETKRLIENDRTEGKQ